MTKVMWINANYIEPITLTEGELQDGTEFPYLGSTEQDIKARTTFDLLKEVWNAREISRRMMMKKMKKDIQLQRESGSLGPCAQ